MEKLINKIYELFPYCKCTYGIMKNTEDYLSYFQLRLVVIIKGKLLEIQQIYPIFDYKFMNINVDLEAKMIVNKIEAESEVIK